MLSCPIASLALLAAITATMRAQTFIVDASNGLGTDYTSLETAWNAVPDGATLIVRAGLYPSTATPITKGLTILAEPGATTYGIKFSSLTANQRVVLKGLRIDNPFAGGIFLQSCAGPVLLEDCTRSPNRPTVVQVKDCAEVAIVRCSFLSSSAPLVSRFENSHVTCIDSEFVAAGTGCNACPGVQIAGLGGHTDLVRCTVRGGQGGAMFVAGSGIVLDYSHLRLLGTGSVSCGNPTASLPALQGAAISGPGWIYVSPGTTFTGQTTLYWTIDHGTTSSTDAPIGGTVTATLSGSANLFGGLLIGFPATGVTVPGVSERLSVDPLGFTITAMLTQPLTWSIDVPNDPILRGFVCGWQGVTASATEVALSNAAWFCIR